MFIQKIGVIGKTYRHMQRYRQILTVLFRYGFGDMIDTLKIEQYLEIGLNMVSKKRRERIEGLTRAEKMRMVVEELGPTFVKMGQILSTRPDLLPQEFLHELQKLQDHVHPFPFDQAKEIIETEIGKPLLETYQQSRQTQGPGLAPRPSSPNPPSSQNSPSPLSPPSSSIPSRRRSFR